MTIFCFGEIDCREALLLSVEKAKYDASNFYPGIIVHILFQIDRKNLAETIYIVIKCIKYAISYQSLEEAIDCVVEIYISLLIRLKELHHWDIYIHPVLPVLDLTRSVQSVSKE